MQDVKVRIHKLSVLRFKRDRSFIFRILAQRLTHVCVSVFEVSHSVRRMQVQRGLQVSVVKLFQEIFGVGEQFLVPSVACGSPNDRGGGISIISLSRNKKRLY